ncbi:helix-turn-helix domain-containing protein [Streptomyces sp. MN03-5084-2B]|nr:helix-turn-helix domain-containing protein [Streptomyces sp. MN03-5084-2B]
MGVGTGHGDAAAAVELAAAERLGVHPDTIRYRLRKMAEVTTLQLDVPAKRLAMIIELVVSDPPG